MVTTEDLIKSIIKPWNISSKSIWITALFDNKYMIINTVQSNNNCSTNNILGSRNLSVVVTIVLFCDFLSNMFFSYIIIIFIISYMLADPEMQLTKI